MNKKKSKHQKKLVLLVCFVLVLLSLYRGQYVPIKEQWVLFDALRTTSSIVFAVIGAWFAIVYPERLRFKKSPSNPTKSDSETNFDRFFLPLIASSIILIIILALGITIPIVKTVSFFLDFKGIGRSISYGILTAMTLIQIWSIFEIIVLSHVIKSIADEHDTKEKMRHQLDKSGTTLSQEDLDKIEVKDFD